MEDSWKPIKHWDTDDELDQWLKEQGLTNSQEIINKVALGEDITYAKGTRRLRYTASKFCLEEYVPPPDIGTGKQLNLEALRKRWQGIVGHDKLTVQFNSSQDVAVSIYVTDEAYIVKLNPHKLTDAAKIRRQLARVEEYLAK